MYLVNRTYPDKTSTIVAVTKTFDLAEKKASAIAERDGLRRQFDYWVRGDELIEIAQWEVSE